MSPADSGAILADVHLHSPDYHEKAIAEFREILKAQPNHAAACRGLGYAYLRKRDFTTGKGIPQACGRGSFQGPVRLSARHCG